jgi:hypothetical protein
MWSHGSRASMGSKRFRSGRDGHASERRPELDDPASDTRFKYLSGSPFASPAR